MDFMDWFFLATLLILCAGRAFYFFLYYKKFWCATCWSSKRDAVLWATRAPAVALIPGTLSVTPEERAARHRRFFDTSEHQVETLFLIGSVALAAWTQLFTGSAASTPGAALSGFSRNLLLASAIILIATPGLFRSNGGQVTYMGRESVTIIGFGSLILALSSFIVDLFGTRGDIMGVALALIVVTRELIHLRSPIKALKWLNTAPPGTQMGKQPSNAGKKALDRGQEPEPEGAERQLRNPGEFTSRQDYKQEERRPAEVVPDGSDGSDGDKEQGMKPQAESSSEPDPEYADQQRDNGRTTNNMDDPSDHPKD